MEENSKTGPVASPSDALEQMQSKTGEIAGTNAEIENFLLEEAREHELESREAVIEEDDEWPDESEIEEEEDEKASEQSRPLPPVISRTVQEVVNQDPDSLTIGTPGNGQVKVYGDFRKPDDMRQRLDNALELLKYADEKKGAGNGKPAPSGGD